MNKIYKVIWSKVRNCYVAVSEFAKRNGKSCSEVSCGAKANRGLAGVALAIALSLSMVGGGVAWGENRIIEVQNPSPVTSDETNYWCHELRFPNGSGAGTGVNFTVRNGGKIKFVYSENSGNTIKINNGGEVTYSGGGYASYWPANSYFGPGILGGVSNNKVEIAGTVNGAVAGGFSVDSSVSNNSVEIKNTAALKYGYADTHIYGGYSVNNTAESNTVTFGATDYEGNIVNTGYIVCGGYSKNGSAKTNTVTINGKVPGNVYGGYSSTNGDATNNHVNINSGGAFHVFGGYSKSGFAGGSTKEQGNHVTVSGGTVSGSIYGAQTESNDGSSKGAEYNKITITGGTINALGGVNGASNGVYGGLSAYHYANNNTIIISGGDFGSNLSTITGGHNKGDVEAKGNTITIAGGNFTSTGFNIVGGRGGNYTSSNIKDNTVNLYGTVTGLDNANLYGGVLYYQGGYNWQGTGNELHIGGVKNSQMVAEGTTLGPWTGKKTSDTTTNKVKYVYNFNKIVLHNVNWSTTTPVLEANGFQFTGNSSGYLQKNYNATLDISDLNLQGTLSPGPMALLKSNVDNFGSMKLTYKDANNTTQSDKEIGSGISLKTISLSGTDTATTGVTLGYTQAQTKVALSADNKVINYIISPEFKTATLGSMNWDAGRTFVSGDVFDSVGLTVSFGSGFKVTGAADKANGQSFNLLDLSATSGKIKNTANKNITVTLADKPVADKLTFSRTRTDTASANAGDQKVTYTTGAKDQVIKATFGTGIEWNKDSTYYTSGTVYTFDSSTAIDAGSLSVAFTDEQKAALKKNDSMTLISATGITESNNSKITPPNSNTVSISKTSDLGTQFTATATGTVAAETGAVKYNISSVDVNTITLGSLAWGSTDSLPETWTASDSTTIDDTNFAYTGTANTKLKQNDTAVILNATGLATNSEVIRDSGASATKTVAMDFTDSSGDGASSIRFTGTAKGHVEAAADKVNYVVDGATLDSRVDRYGL